MAWAIYWVSFTATIGASIFAIAKGDVPARWGGLLRLSILMLEFLIQATLHSHLQNNNIWMAVDDLADTAFVSFGFLYLALRYALSLIHI